MRTKRIGVLAGGLSAEREVSLRTGEAIAAALVDRGCDARLIIVDRDLDVALRQAGIDLAFVALHGRYGEDGCVQGLLELLGIPYTGSGVLASALAMNKIKAKEIFRLHNLPTPPYYLLSPDDDVLDAHGAFGFPAVVKPCGEGSSVGVAVVRSEKELRVAADAALRFDDEVLVERFIEGKEVSVGVLNDRPLGAVEIAPKHGFYDYANKYTAGRSEYHLPARVSPERYRGILWQATAACRALGVAGAARVDMIVSDRGNEYILEVNTIPGMTPTSLLPKIAHHAGLDFGDLVLEMLGAARLHAHGHGRRERRVAELPYAGPERRAAGIERH
ncbi:MAG TPA: D-alanine--D-alanine ligase [Haliangiales bacterium]|nr:D-alanine--D-alanine ligase [Haliangiales bacterium]